MKNVILCWLALLAIPLCAQPGLQNNLFTIISNPEHTLTVETAGVSPQTLRPEFTILYSATDLQIADNNHDNYLEKPFEQLEPALQTRPKGY